MVRPLGQSDPTAQLVKALMAFADRRSHWPDCPQRRGCFTTFVGLNEIDTPCSKRCRQAREAIEAAGGAVERSPHRVLDPKDTRTLADILARRPGCSLIRGAEYHQPGCCHGARNDGEAHARHCR